MAGPGRGDSRGMKISQLLAVAVTAALVLPGTALAGTGNGKPGGSQRATETQTIRFRTLEGPAASPEKVTIRRTRRTAEEPQGGEVVATPGPSAPAAAKAKAYGRRCAGQSRKRVAGQRGTAFSRCVTAMARVATGRRSAKAACKGLSTKHVKGTKGTPFSRCVVAAAKLVETMVEETAPLKPIEPIEPETTEPPAPVTEPAPEAPTRPVETTDPVEPPVA